MPWIYLNKKNSWKKLLDNLTSLVSVDCWRTWLGSSFWSILTSPTTVSDVSIHFHFFRKVFGVHKTKFQQDWVSLSLQVEFCSGPEAGFAWSTLGPFFWRTSMKASNVDHLNQFQNVEEQFIRPLWTGFGDKWIFQTTKDIYLMSSNCQKKKADGT